MINDCRLSVAQQELVMYTDKMTKQAQQIADYEYQISQLRKHLESLETEHEKDKQKIADLEELLKKAREVSTSYCFCMFSRCRASWVWWRLARRYYIQRPIAAILRRQLFLRRTSYDTRRKNIMRLN